MIKCITNCTCYYLKNASLKVRSNQLSLTVESSTKDNYLPNYYGKSVTTNVDVQCANVSILQKTPAIIIQNNQILMSACDWIVICIVNTKPPYVSSETMSTIKVTIRPPKVHKLYSDRQTDNDGGFVGHQTMTRQNTSKLPLSCAKLS